ncbi:MAG: trypsin-like peptidase domain-containing protein [Candidatus Nitrosopolaris sp.]
MGEKFFPDSKTRNKSALVSLSEEIQNVADKVSKSVVSVRSRTRGNGSGVVWNSDGLILTCSHIVRKLAAKVIGNDPYSDIALLKIQSNDKNDDISLNPIEIGDSDNLKAGQFVLALANPYGEYPSITEGIITSERSSLGGSHWGTIADNVVITDARLNPGYSGGPLVDVEGKMIGLNTAYVSSRGIAIRASKVRNVAEQLVKDGAINIAYLGIVTAEISLPNEVGVQLGLNQEEGLIILSVEKDTPAKKAGLLTGDIIVRLDDQPITNIHNLRRQLLKPDTIGKSIILGIIRGEKKIELSITPREAPRST